jgi:hypothetical protein
MLNEDELQDALLLVFANKQDLLMVMNTVDNIRDIRRYPVFVPHSVDLQHEELQ